jgi:hypothetical protein
VADSDALRTRRRRAHAAGDHSLCKRCPVVRIEAEGEEIPASDRAKLRWLAEGLARAYQADPGNALLARELRMTLQALLGGGDANDRDRDIEDLFAELSST